MTKNKSPGQIAYEQELQIVPNYHDGTKRPPWSKLCDVAKWSWERNPKPRTGLVKIMENMKNVANG